MILSKISLEILSRISTGYSKKVLCNLIRDYSRILLEIPSRILPSLISRGSFWDTCQAFSRDSKDSPGIALIYYSQIASKDFSRDSFSECFQTSFNDFSRHCLRIPSQISQRNPAIIPSGIISGNIPEFFMDCFPGFFLGFLL